MSKRILVVDDQEIERTALRTIFAQDPTWLVSEATDGGEALEQICTGAHPHLCMVDLRMPKVDGIEFLRRLRRDPALRGIKVIVTSATRDRATIVELAKLGVEGYLLKPVDPAKTISLVKPIMDALPDPDGEPRELKDLLTKTAFIADDDPVSRLALATFIKNEPHWTVVEFDDGRSVLDQLASGPLPDICFLDLRMPGMDGAEVLAAIRRHPKLEKIRVAITSAQRDLDQIRELARLRIDGYMLKPLDAAKVRSTLRAIP